MQLALVIRDINETPAIESRPVKSPVTQCILAALAISQDGGLTSAEVARVLYGRDWATGLRTVTPEFSKMRRKGLIYNPGTTRFDPDLLKARKVWALTQLGSLEAKVLSIMGVCLTDDEQDALARMARRRGKSLPTLVQEVVRQYIQKET